MIGRGHVTFLDDVALLQINVYVQQGILRMRELNSIAEVWESAVTFGEIAKEIIASKSRVRT